MCVIFLIFFNPLPQQIQVLLLSTSQMILFLLCVRKNEGSIFGNSQSSYVFARKYNELNLKNKQKAILKAFFEKNCKTWIMNEWIIIFGTQWKQVNSICKLFEKKH